MVLIVWLLVLQLPMPITTEVVSSNPSQTGVLDMILCDKVICDSLVVFSGYSGFL